MNKSMLTRDRLVFQAITAVINSDRSDKSCVESKLEEASLLKTRKTTHSAPRLEVADRSHQSIEVAKVGIHCLRHRGRLLMTLFGVTVCATFG